MPELIEFSLHKVSHPELPATTADDLLVLSAWFNDHNDERGPICRVMSENLHKRVKAKRSFREFALALDSFPMESRSIDLVDDTFRSSISGSMTRVSVDHRTDATSLAAAIVIWGLACRFSFATVITRRKIDVIDLHQRIEILTNLEAFYQMFPEWTTDPSADRKPQKAIQIFSHDESVERCNWNGVAPELLVLDDISSSEIRPSLVRSGIFCVEVIASLRDHLA